jgi:predicted membrane channel-forming protein YqfA (hemolysin III family)
MAIILVLLYLFYLFVLYYQSKIYKTINTKEVEKNYKEVLNKKV